MPKYILINVMGWYHLQMQSTLNNNPTPSSPSAPGLTLIPTVILNSNQIPMPPSYPTLPPSLLNPGLINLTVYMQKHRVLSYD